MRFSTASGLVIILGVFASPGLQRASAGNIALNPTRAGFPHPLESDNGWGGGWDKWDIVDGNHEYASWANGLAFTGGSHSWGGEPAGLRQATINFGGMWTFNKVVIWHHGLNDVPATANLEYWNGANWVDIGFVRDFDIDYVGSGLPGWSKPDTYVFDDSVTGSKVRYSFDNSRDSILGTPMRHGWIYEFEVMEAPSVSDKHLDIKPGSCPNALNQNTRGVLPVAVLGAEDFDVSTIDTATILLTRDVVYGGVAPVRANIEDVASPFEGELCECHDLSGDGLPDLVLKFPTEDIVDALELNSVPGDESVMLTVTGNLENGEPFTASDCVWLVPAR